MSAKAFSQHNLLHTVKMQEKSESSDLPEPAISTTHAEVLNDQIYKEDNAVLVDLGAADGDNAPNPLLKLRKDGHVSCPLLGALD